MLRKQSIERNASIEMRDFSSFKSAWCQLLDQCQAWPHLKVFLSQKIFIQDISGHLQKKICKRQLHVFEQKMNFLAFYPPNPETDEASALL